MPGKSHGQSSLTAYSLWSRVRRDLATKQQQLFVNAYLHLRTGGCGPALGPSLSQLTIPSHPVEGGSCSCSPATFGIRFRSVGLFRILLCHLLFWCGGRACEEMLNLGTVWRRQHPMCCVCFTLKLLFCQNRSSVKGVDFSVFIYLVCSFRDSG